MRCIQLITASAYRRYIGVQDTANHFSYIRRNWRPLQYVSFGLQTSYCLCKSGENHGLGSAVGAVYRLLSSNMPVATISPIIATPRIAWTCRWLTRGKLRTSERAWRPTRRLRALRTSESRSTSTVSTSIVLSTVSIVLQLTSSTSTGCVCPPWTQTAPE